MGKENHDIWRVTDLPEEVAGKTKKMKSELLKHKRRRTKKSAQGKQKSK